MSHLNPNPSICIPRVFTNIGEERVYNVFQHLRLGKIQRIDIIERKNERGEPYKRVFIHFDYWYNTPEARAACNKLLDGKELKIVYDDPWFWKASINNWIPEQQHIQQSRYAPHIDWNDERPERQPQRPERRDDRQPQRLERQPQRPERRDDRQPQRPERQPQRPERRDDRQPQSERRDDKKNNTASLPVVTRVTNQVGDLPVKKRVMPLIPKQKLTKKLSLEEGEVIEGELTEEEEKLAEMLYSDL